jgi:hypothetical protein
MQQAAVRLRDNDGAVRQHRFDVEVRDWTVCIAIQQIDNSKAATNSYPAFLLPQDYHAGQHSNQELVDFLSGLPDLEDEPRHLLIPKGDEFISCLHLGSAGNGARRVWDTGERPAHSMHAKSSTANIYSPQLKLWLFWSACLPF